MLIPIILDGEENRPAEESYYLIRTFRSHQVLDKRYEKSFISKDKNLVKSLISIALSKTQSEHVVNTTSSHSEHMVNTSEEMEMEDEEKPSNEGSKKSFKFTPPGIDEVASYISAKGYHVDAEKFVNFYESKGWYVGKNKMKNWHAAIATWEKTEKQRNGNQNRNPYPNKQEANDYALHALQERMEQRRSGLQDELPKPF